ncbi:MAG: hypothetical protein RMJ87_09415 [Cytophagales bacterium]|nr:hypothetical protein [Bernardetiaceae bacterium]MDW8205234.1 hypothetical protein [Cytophagales bacterium]
MEFTIELLKIILPAGIVLYGMYLTIRAFLNKDFERRLVELKAKYIDVSLPLRLQAYERMALFLERISAPNLLMRLNNSEMNAIQLQSVLLEEIRNEFAHNFSQQVYMSDEAWEKIRSAMDNMVAMINHSATEVPPEAPSIQLAKAIMSNIIAQNDDITGQALKFLKAEVRNFL